MSNKITEDYIDDLPEASSLDEADDAEAAFWDEFSYLEDKRVRGSGSYTVTIEDELTGEKKIYKNVRLGVSNKKNLSN